MVDGKDKRCMATEWSQMNKAEIPAEYRDGGKVALSGRIPDNTTVTKHCALHKLQQ